MKVKRYNVSNDSYRNGYREVEDGPWCKSEDVAMLEALGEQVARAYQELELKYKALKKLAEEALGGEIEISVEDEGEE